jgi:hypothetical protein
MKLLDENQHFSRQGQLPETFSLQHQVGDKLFENVTAANPQINSWKLDTESSSSLQCMYLFQDNMEHV